MLDRVQCIATILTVCNSKPMVFVQSFLQEQWVLQREVHVSMFISIPDGIATCNSNRLQELNFH